MGDRKDELESVRQERERALAFYRGRVRELETELGIADPGGHARALAMMAWFVSRGATSAGQWPGDPEDFAKQNRARDEFEAWWRGR